MSIVIIKGMKLEFSEIHDHLLNCKKCSKARKEFHDMLEWHKKVTNETEDCPNCKNPEHIHNCSVCKNFLNKFHLTLSAHLIEIVAAKMKLF